MTDLTSLIRLVVERRWFYGKLPSVDWIAGLLGWSRGAVELASAIIPAVVIDVAAPVLLFVVFFL